jgi:hypothetical protein
VRLRRTADERKRTTKSLPCGFLENTQQRPHNTNLPGTPPLRGRRSRFAMHARTTNIFLKTKNWDLVPRAHHQATTTTPTTRPPHRCRGRSPTTAPALREEARHAPLGRDVELKEVAGNSVEGPDPTGDSGCGRAVVEVATAAPGEEATVGWRGWSPRRIWSHHAWGRSSPLHLEREPPIKKQLELMY